MSAGASGPRASAVAILALLRRDLSSGRRGATAATARFVVVLLSGAIAIAALAFSPQLFGRFTEAALIGWMLPWVLALLSLLLLPVLALQALSSEREAGTLDLLLLAGLSPGHLAFGRWLSIFLLLESLLLDALPAMSVFVFFGAPDPADLAWGALALSGWNALLAGIAIALAAAIRRPATCAAAAVALQLGLTAGAAWAGGSTERLQAVVDLVPAPPLLLMVLTASKPLQLQLSVTQGQHLLGACGCLLVGLALSRIAARWIARSGAPSRARGGSATSRRLWASPPIPLAGEPLPWLLRRTNPPLRPFALALLASLALPSLALYLELHDRLGGGGPGALQVFGEEWLSFLALFYWLLGLFIATFAGALQVARARERNEWDTLLGATVTGRRLVRGLLAGPAAAAAVPLAFSAACFFGLSAVAPSETVGALPVWAAGPVALAGTGAFALVLGLATSLVARSQAGALGLCLMLLGTAVTAAWVLGWWIDQTDLGSGFDAASRGWAVALAVSIVLPLQVFLLERRRTRPRPAGLLFELSCGAVLIAPPLVQAMARAASAEAMALLGLAAGVPALALLLVVLRRPDCWLGRVG